jgi:hypothetical protein
MRGSEPDQARSLFADNAREGAMRPERLDVAPLWGARKVNPERPGSDAYHSSRHTPTFGPAGTPAPLVVVVVPKPGLRADLIDPWLVTIRGRTDLTASRARGVP